MYLACQPDLTVLHTECKIHFQMTSWLMLYMRKYGSFLVDSRKKNRAKNAQYIMGSKRYEVLSEFYITQQIVLNFFNSKLYKIQIFFAREQSFLELNLNLTQLRIEKM